MNRQEPGLGSALTDLDVSRETIQRLAKYAALLKKWNPAINLVAPSTLPDLWVRHIDDSAQIWDLLPPDAKTLVDFGAGAGFPGLIIACLAKERRPDLRVVCLESDARKGAFLQTVIRDLDLRANVVTARIENAQPQYSDVVTARALASLKDLLGHADRHLAKHGSAIFLKGSLAEQEIADARSKWLFDINAYPSKTSNDGQILVLKEIKRV